MHVVSSTFLQVCMYCIIMTVYSSRIPNAKCPDFRGKIITGQPKVSWLWESIFRGSIVCILQHLSSLTVSGDSQLTLCQVHLSSDDIEIGQSSSEHGVIQHWQLGTQRHWGHRDLQHYVSLLFRLQVSQGNLTAARLNNRAHKKWQKVPHWDKKVTFIWFDPDSPPPPNPNPA